MNGISFKRTLSRLGWAALLLASLFSLAAPADARDLTVRAADKFVIHVVVNGHSLRLRVDPECPGFVVVNPDVARRLGLRPSLLDVEAVIGPVRMDGHTKVAAIHHEGTRFRRRFAWVPRNAADDVDGLINPASLPYERVIFDLGPRAAGELSSQFQVSYTREYGLLLPLRIGERTVRFQFSTQKPQSMATAAAGAHLSQTHGGSWAGDAVTRLIEMGVHRPVRPMTLERPVALHNLLLGQFLVRTSDHGGGAILPGEPSSDPEEIVVTAQTGQDALYMLTVGLDRLSACSSMIYERAHERLTIRCAAGLPAG